MKRLSPKLGLVAALFSVIAMFAGNMPSASAVGAGVVTGGGTISPGIPGPTGGTVSNSVSFGGTATGIFSGGPDAGSCTIGFTGSGTDSTAIGSGSGTANCNGTGVLGKTISLNNCNVQYFRVGDIVIVVITGGNCGTGVGAFIFIPGQTPPNTVTSYSLVGVVAITG